MQQITLRNNIPSKEQDQVFSFQLMLPFQQYCLSQSSSKYSAFNLINGNSKHRDKIKSKTKSVKSWIQLNFLTSKWLRLKIIEVKVNDSKCCWNENIKCLNSDVMTLVSSWGIQRKYKKAILSFKERRNQQSFKS